MAPIPLTPTENNYHVVKTPEGHHLQQQHEAKSGVSAWSSRFRVYGQVAQFLILVAMGLYVFGQLYFFLPDYNTGAIRRGIARMWGMKLDKEGKTSPGHSEMLRPTFYIFFAILPVLASIYLVEFLRHYNIRRLSSRYLLKLAMILRRKPSIGGKVSYWSYGEWIFMAFLIVGNVIVFYYFYTSRVDKYKQRAKKAKQPINFDVYLKALSLTLGFNCIYNMAFLFLPATRNCAWMEIMNISYANGVKYHRWLGVVTVLTALFHCIGYYVLWIRLGTWKKEALPCFNCNLASDHGHDVWFNVFGELALLCFLAIGITSIPIVRRQLYNVFYYVHQLLFPAVIFAIMHWAPIVWWVFPTFLAYCYSRAVSSSNAWCPVQVQELTALSGDIVKVVLKRTPGRDGHYRVGQFLYLNVPAISKLQWHAFTIASSPRTSATTVTVLLKSLGDWTQDLVEHSNACKKENILPTVYVDGYYGASLEMYEEYSTLLLVGGGIGATPMFAILEDLVAKLTSNAHEAITQRVVFIFSFRELSLLEEVHPVLLRLKELDPEEKYHRLHFFLTRAPTEELLSQPVDYERLGGRSIQPTKYAAGLTSTPRAFFEPLRSRTFKIVVVTVIFLFATVMVCYLEYGNGKIKRNHKELWPLQQFVEASMLIVGGFLTWFFILYERKAKDSNGGSAAESKEIEIYAAQHTAGTPTIPSTDVHTYNDLLSHYKVVVGQRPDTKSLISETYEFHTSHAVEAHGKPVIGVFVSGPEALKRACEYAAADIGTQHFDIHEEEFEM